MAHLTPERLADQLRLLQQWNVIYLGLAYTQLPVVSFTREVLQLEGAARDKALRKLELLERTLLTPVPNPRPMYPTQFHLTRPPALAFAPTPTPPQTVPTATPLSESELAPHSLCNSRVASVTLRELPAWDLGCRLLNSYEEYSAQN